MRQGKWISGRHESGIHSILILVVLTAVFCGPVLAADSVSVTSLRCEFRDTPLGIDSPQPRLSWNLKPASPAFRGLMQTAYQVMAASSADVLAKDQPDLWDSSKVQSDQSAGVVYAGKPLASGQQVFWKVRIWDNAGQPSPWSQPATWTMGLLKPSDWKAEWIMAAGADRRTARGYHAAEADREDDTKWVQVDLGQAMPIETIRLLPMRHADKDGFGFPIRFKVEIADEPEFNQPILIADHTADDYPNPGIKPVEFDARNTTGRYIRLTATKLGKYTTRYCLALNQIEILSKGKNAAVGAAVAAKDTVEQFGWGKDSLTDGKGLLDLEQKSGKAYDTTLLRCDFTVKSGLTRAVVFVCGLGHYQMTLNGQKVSDDLLSPGWSNYKKTCLYDTYDITGLLKEGPNAAGLSLGNGMYNVPGGRYIKFDGSFGPQKAIAHLRLDYADGSTQTLVTDGTWRTHPGPVTFSCVYGGEDYDARLEQPGWDKPGFDAAGWDAAKITNGPGGQLKGLSCAAPPIRAFDVLKPVHVTDLSPGVKVYDLGQNASMMPRLTVTGPAGATVKVIPSELVRPNGDIEDVACGGNSYLTYTHDGGPARTWQPSFYYRGARYLRVECSKDAQLESIEGVVVHSSSTPVGEFACSNDLFNRIHTLVRWAQRSNMVSVMTDCPHREKLGWLEQYHLNGPSLRYEFDLAALFTKGTNDMADSQLENGLMPNIAPEYVIFPQGGETQFRESVEWGAALIEVPWQQYLWSGDIELMRRFYGPMKRYFDYLGTFAPDGILSIRGSLGDWYDIGPAGPGKSQLTPVDLTATAIYYECACILSRAAKLLGYHDDAAAFTRRAEVIRTAYNKKYFNPQTGQYATGSQTANAMSLVTGLVEEANRQSVLNAIVSDVQARGLTAGDVGYRYLLRALADGGRSDVIYQMNNQSEKPGYGYQLKMGATSLTEAWDAGRASSQNHFMLGQIMEWFYHDLAGIQPDPAAPGFKNIIIRPAILKDLQWVKAAYDSVYGRIESHWTCKDDTLTLNVTIPANTTALVYVPARDAAAVNEAGQSAAQSSGAVFVRTEGHCLIYKIQSGSYSFTASLPK